MATRSLYEHIASDTGIARYTAHAQRLMRFQRCLETVLPPAIRPHARIANMRADKLVIYTSNASVAAKVRHLAPRLAGVIALEGVKLSEIDVRVQVSAFAPMQTKVNSPKPLPGESAQKSLAGLAQSLPDSSALKEPLLRLLRRVKAQ
jgi:hypothetical protein